MRYEISDWSTVLRDHDSRASALDFVHQGQALRFEFRGLDYPGHRMAFLVTMVMTMVIYRSSGSSSMRAPRRLRSPGGRNQKGRVLVAIAPASPAAPARRAFSGSGRRTP